MLVRAAMAAIADRGKRKPCRRDGTEEVMVMAVFVMTARSGCMRAKNAASARRRNGRHRRLGIEPLESRRLPSAVPVGSEFPVNSYIAGNQQTSANTGGSARDVALDAAHDSIVVWQSAGQGGDVSTDSNIYAQRYNSLGVAVGGEMLVNTYTAGNQSNPAVAMDTAGDFVVTWQSDGQEGAGLGTGIYARRFSWSSGSWEDATEFHVNTFTANAQSDPAVAMNAQGGFIIAWDSAGQDSDPSTSTNIYAKRFDSGANPLSVPGQPGVSEFRVNTIQGGNQTLPAIACDSSGNFVIAYQGGGGEEWSAANGGGTSDGSSGIFARRYDSAGNAQETGDFLVNTTRAGNQANAAVAMLPGTGYVIVWNSVGQDADTGTITNVYATRFDLNDQKLDVPGQPAGTKEFRVNTYQTSNQRNPAVATDSAGNFTVVWRSFGESTNQQSPTSDDIYGQQFAAAGTAIGSEFSVNTYTSNTQSAPAIGMDPAGDFLVAWDSSGEDSDGYGVFGQRYQGPSTPVSTADSYTVNRNQTFTVTSGTGVLANDVDPHGQTLTAVLVASPSDSSLTLNSDGSFTYVPVSGFVGVDQFTYVASNGTNTSWVPTTVSLTIVDQSAFNAVAAQLLSFATTTASGGGSLTTIKSRENLSGANAGSFNNSSGTELDYSGTTDQSGSDYTTTAEYLWTLAQTYQAAPDANLLSTYILPAFTFLANTAGAPNFPNWYDSQIALPNALWPALLILRQQLNPSLLTSLTNKYFATPNVWFPTESSGDNTGANLTMRATAGIAEAVISNDPVFFTARWASVLSYVTADVAGDDGVDEGLQADDSEHQHNTIDPPSGSLPAAEFYSGGYGIDYSRSLAQLLSWTHGTSYAFSSTTETQAVGFLLDGIQWLMRGTALEPTSLGRSVTRPGKITGSLATELLRALPSYETLGIRTTELQNFATQLTPGSGVMTNLSGNHAYWTSDFMVQQRSGYMDSVRMISDRTKRPEQLSGEGLQSYYEGDGVTTLYVTGTEYGSTSGSEIFPIWNWTRLPGTTIEQTPLPPTTSANDTKSDPSTDLYDQYVGGESFVGSDSDGTYGFSAMDYARPSNSYLPVYVTAKKSYFFLDGEVVELGAGVSADDPGANPAEVDTTLNQVLLQSNVVVEAANGTQTSFGNGTTMDLTNPHWALQAGVGYVFLGNNGNVVVQAQTQSSPTGNWSDINTNYASTTAVPQAVFTAYVDQGVNPQNATYAFALVPNTTASGLDSYYNNLPLTVVSNTPSLQAVRENALGITQAAFYAAGTLTLADGLSVTASAPCLVMIEEGAGGAVEISVSDPTQSLAQVQLTINWHLAGVGLSSGTTLAWDSSSQSSLLTFALPTGTMAGSSDVQDFSVVNSAPTINPLATLYLPMTSGQQAVGLTGIGIGTGDSGQTLTVTAISSNPNLVPNPTVTYTSPSATGSLSFTPVAEAGGSATITVTVHDNGGTANGGSDTTTTTFTVDVGNPRVVGVYVASSDVHGLVPAWTSDFEDFLDSSGAGAAAVTGATEQGYSLPSGPNQYKPLPWTNLDTLRIAFDEDVDISSAALMLSGAKAEPSVQSFSYDRSDHIATWIFSTALGLNASLIELDNTLVTLANGARLDGAWNDQVSKFADQGGTGSGTGVGSGTDFDFGFFTLPGDVNGIGTVISGSAIHVRNALGASEGMPLYTYRADILGQGTVLSPAFVTVRNDLGTSIASLSIPAAGANHESVPAGVSADEDSSPPATAMPAIDMQLDLSAPAPQAALPAASDSAVGGSVLGSASPTSAGAPLDLSGALDQPDPVAGLPAQHTTNSTAGMLIDNRPSWLTPATSNSLPDATAEAFADESFDPLAGRQADDEIALAPSLAISGIDGGDV
jgi:hypothetical protein